MFFQLNSAPKAEYIAAAHIAKRENLVSWARKEFRKIILGSDSGG